MAAMGLGQWQHRDEEQPAQMHSQPEDPGGMSCLLVVVVTFAALSGLIMGYDLCIVAVVLDHIKDEFDLCDGNFSCIAKSAYVAILAPGAAVGSILGGVLADHVGRRIALAMSDLCFVIGAALMGLGELYWILLCGRIFIGFGVGVGFVVFTTYVGEISPPSRRGQLVTCQEVAQCGGCLLSYLLGALAGNDHWRLYLSLAGVAALIQLAGVFILPESPRWYMMKGRQRDAVAVLRRLYPRQEQAVLSQIHDMELQATRYHEAHSNELWGTRKVVSELHRYRQQLVVAVGCALCQNMTAANSILYYSADIFKLAGVSDPFLPGVGVGAMKMTGVVATLLLVERCGRRRLLLLGSFGTLCCHMMFVVVFALVDAEGANAWGNRIPACAVAVMLAFMFFWNISWAGLMFVVAIEVLPNAIRGVGMGITLFAFWVAAFVVQSTLETLFSVMTKAGTFAFYSLLNAVVIFFVKNMIPETTGRSLEDISDHFRSEDVRTLYTSLGSTESEEALVATHKIP